MFGHPKPDNVVPAVRVEAVPVRGARESRIEAESAPAQNTPILIFPIKRVGPLPNITAHIHTAIRAVTLRGIFAGRRRAPFIITKVTQLTGRF